MIRFPAEFEKHTATWIGWPHNKLDWPGKFTPIPWVYGEITRRIAEGEKVRILVENDAHKQKALNVLQSCHAPLGNVEFYKFPTDRGWTRDSGPCFTYNNSEKTVLAFKFNAWAKYSNYKKDCKLPGFISKKSGLPLLPAEYNQREVVLEGGAIDHNGNGTLITTEECLLDPVTQVRNEGFTKKDYAEVFRKYLGINNVIWLRKGIAGDDTHGHIDDICRFVNANTVVAAIESNPNDVNYKPLKENLELLSHAKLEDGSSINIIEMPMPDPLYFRGVRVPASYANFYFTNAAVLVPTFNDTKDRIALGILGEVIKDRPVIGIHAVDLVWGFGTLHCLTKEEP
jgi:agmatine deiminase